MAHHYHGAPTLRSRQDRAQAPIDEDVIEIGYEPSGNQGESVDVVWAYDAEVAPVDGCDLADAQSLRRGYHRCVDGAQWQVSIPRDKLSDADPVRGSHGLDPECAGGEVAEEPHLRFHTETGTEQVDHLGEDERQDDQRAGMCFEQLQRRSMVGVVCVDIGI
jgi:hypothetical protein